MTPGGWPGGPSHRDLYEVDEPYPKARRAHPANVATGVLGIAGVVAGVLWGFGTEVATQLADHPEVAAAAAALGGPYVALALGAAAFLAQALKEKP